ncbi:NSFL1 cofactor p47-like isoform X1 [Rhodnius prolixus]
MEEKKEKELKEFCNITGTSLEKGTFFLESAQWNFEVAVANFFDLNDTAALTNYLAEMDGESKPTEAQDAATNNISGSTSNDENNDLGQAAFYAGGSVSSGQQILGPANSANIIMDMFHTARSSFFSVGDPTVNETTFQGHGHRLGRTGEDGQVIESENNAQNLVDMVLRVWSNGFTVDEGQLRNLENPGDREFLNLITTGQVPPEIAPSNGSAVRLKVEDHRFETFKNHPRKQVPFSGQGHILGTTIDPPETSNKDNETTTENEEFLTVPIDKNLPVTTVQLRLSNGRTVKVKLNHNHTIGELRTYITTLGPQYSTGNFRLLTSFPSKELNDNNITVEQAGILNSSLLLRVK